MKRKTTNLTNRAAWDNLPTYFELTLEEGLEGRTRKVLVAKVKAEEPGCVWACNLEVVDNGMSPVLATFKLRDFNKGNIEQCLFVSTITPNPFAESDGVIVGSLSEKLHALIEKRGKLKAV